ncbi:MAG: hypothetical protein HQM08_05835 [Candidatus Riflebacteria bacterium]|nr:hypothetical protein [Candidatus Riflebacteria bacterium]
MKKISGFLALIVLFSTVLATGYAKENITPFNENKEKIVIGGAAIPNEVSSNGAVIPNSTKRTENPARNEHSKTFKGAWFEIQYPEDFTVEPSLKSTTNVSGYDSAFFVSPSKEVSFYVFSPQWNGKPTDILLKTDKETELALKKTEKNGVVVIECTIAAKDGSYTRSYLDVEYTKSNTRKVFGLSYRDHKVYDQYKDRYIQFKSSLIQFAD